MFKFFDFFSWIWLSWQHTRISGHCLSQIPFMFHQKPGAVFENFEKGIQMDDHLSGQ